MNIRQGFHRLSMFVLALGWAIWMLITATESGSHMMSSLPYMFGFTLGYLAFCKAVAWVYSGFTGK